MKSPLGESLTRRYLFLMACLVTFTAYSSQTFFSRDQRTNLETRLREKAAFINRYTADRIATALIQKDDITLLQTVNQLEEDPEVFSVFVIDQRGGIRYHRDAEKVGTPSTDPALLNTLKTGEAGISTYQNSGGKAMALLTPLMARGMANPLLGAIRIDLTYRNVELQVTASRKRFWFVILGALVTCTAFVTMYTNRWVLTPLEYIKKTLGTINPAAPEPTFYVGTDEFGQVAASLNDLLNQFKTEIHHHLSQKGNRGENERLWVANLAATLLPGARVLVADKDNRVVADSDEKPGKKPGKRMHLLDLITDSNFANLLTAAFQKEGTPSRGPVLFQDKSYNAMILSMPGQQAVSVKTIIALTPNSN